MSATDNAADFAALNAAWKRRCIGVETLQSAPLAVLLLIPLCEMYNQAPRSGDIITDALRAVEVLVDRMADRIDYGGEFRLSELHDIARRVEVLRELRRRERGGGRDRDPSDAEVPHDDT